MWDERKAKLRAAFDAKRGAGAITKREYHPHDFFEALAGLGDDLVDEQSYLEAAQAGIDAAPKSGGVKAPSVADSWLTHVRKYANDVAGRIAAQLADFSNDVVDDDTLDADTVAQRIDDKLEAFRSSITRYSEPPWGVGNQGYGNALEASGVLLVWVLEDGVEHCDTCPELAAGSPYERGTIPTWPKAGDTPCRDRCYCYVTADPDSWAAAFGG